MPKLFVNRLTVIDFSYLHSERGLLGETWLMDLELEGALDGQGMVLDFGLIKKQVKTLVDNEFDHKLLAPSYHPHCEIKEESGDAVIHFAYGNQRQLFHRSPADAVCDLPVGDITIETVTRSIHDRLEQVLPGNIDRITVHLYAEEGPGAFYHYSHGLKQHQGNCLRIAHGHRSRLQIFQDGEQNEVLERQWVDRWRDIYIAKHEDLSEEMEINDLTYNRFSYGTRAGDFQLQLPKENCYLIDTDSTVENLAQHIADVLHKKHPDSRFVVRAYEGVDKGAIGKSGDFPEE